MARRKRLDLAGQRFGRLTAIRPASKKGRKTRWRCLCDCGCDKLVITESLMAGVTQSCGCLRAGPTALGYKHGALRNRIYRIWRGMLSRCGHSGDTYPHPQYAGRGLTVCAEWRDFYAFQDWALTNGYHYGKSIDRIDNDKGYSPDNCRWATAIEQNNNRRCCHRIEVRGQAYTIAEAGRRFGITPATIANRLKRGASPERAVSRERFTG